ncbi:MAG: SCO family protein [Planctomycetes bacterium]|nr:SCO family protein [Planctomycetota bacterium]
MTRVRRYTLLVPVAAAALATIVALPLPARAGNDGLVPQHDRSQGPRPEAGITEQIGAQVPLDLTFRDENEQPIALGDAMGGRPTILVPVYYRCPMLCTEILNEVLDALREMPANFTAGNQFSVVTVSMDPKEHGDLARAKKKAYLTEYGRPGADRGWRFLTGTKESIAALLDTVGYRFEFDKMLKEYDHPSGIVILSPQGKVTRYFHGLSYRGEKKLAGPEVRGPDGKVTRPTTTLRLSLVEAADGKGGSLLDQITLLCYRYDRLHQGYSLNVLRAVQIGGLVTLLAVAAGALIAVRREGILRGVLGRVVLFVLICVAVSGLGLGGSLWRSGDTTLASVLLALSFLSVLGVTVIAYRRGRAARTEDPPAPVEGPNTLPSGGTA